MILISVTAVAGIGCIIAAFVMGADPRQIRNYTEGKTSGKLQTEERNIRADQIRKLNIDIGSGNVKLQNGNQDHLIIKKKGSWEPVILKSDGEIEIKQKRRHFKLFWFQSNDEITVILPKGVTFEKVSMDCGSGDIASDSLNITDELAGHGNVMEFRKPNDLPFLIMRKRLEIPCRNMAFVGDDIEKDFIAPKALGMECYWKKNEDGLYE